MGHCVHASSPHTSRAKLQPKSANLAHAGSLRDTHADSTWLQREHPKIPQSRKNTCLYTMSELPLWCRSTGSLLVGYCSDVSNMCMMAQEAASSESENIPPLNTAAVYTFSTFGTILFHMIYDSCTLPTVIQLNHPQGERNPHDSGIKTEWKSEHPIPPFVEDIQNG